MLTGADPGGVDGVARPSGVIKILNLNQTVMIGLAPSDFDSGPYTCTTFTLL